MGTTNRKRRKTNHKLTQLRGLAEDEPEELQVDSIKRTCVRRKDAEELAEAIGSWWEVCGRGNRKEDWNVPLQHLLLLHWLQMMVPSCLIRFFYNMYNIYNNNLQAMILSCRQWWIGRSCLRWIFTHSRGFTVIWHINTWCLACRWP